MAEVAREKSIEPAEMEVWFAGEARIGQKDKITRRRARRGTRPAAASDQRTSLAPDQQGAYGHLLRLRK
jgi:hypothetical protein